MSGASVLEQHALLASMVLANMAAVVGLWRKLNGHLRIHHEINQLRAEKDRLVRRVEQLETERQAGRRTD